MAELPISRDDAVRRLAATSGLTIDQAKAFLRAQAELACSHADRGFPIPGIGRLKKIESPGRTIKITSGPNAGQDMTIPARKSLKFQVSRLARSAALDESGQVPDVFSLPQIDVFKFSTAATEMADSSVFCSDLGGPFTLSREDTRVPFAVYRLTELNLPTGRVMVGDGLVGGGISLNRSVPPGRYPIHLVAAQLGTDSRIALAVLRITANAVTKWEPATFDGRVLPTTREGEPPGYGVDSGTGSFGDAGAWKILADVFEGDDGAYDRIIAEMDVAYRPTRTWVHLDSPGGSIAMFSSGWGDGVYTSYFGLDREGIPAAIVTDFEILRWGPLRQE